REEADNRLLSPGLRPASNRHLIAAVDPHFHSDNTEGRVCFRETIIDIGSQRMKRKPALQIPLRSRNLSSIQPARHANLDALCAKALSALDRSSHRSAKRNSFFELL